MFNYRVNLCDDPDHLHLSSASLELIIYELDSQFPRPTVGIECGFDEIFH